MVRERKKSSAVCPFCFGPSHHVLFQSSSGKTFTDSKGDVFRGLEMIESACFMAPQMLGDSLQGIATNMDCVSYREPLGVVASLNPFNFPAMCPLWSVGLCTTAGNTILIKPSEKTPGASMMLAQLAKQRYEDKLVCFSGAPLSVGIKLILRRFYP